MELKKIELTADTHLNYLKLFNKNFIVIKKLNKVQYIRVPSEVKWQLFSTFCLIENSFSFFHLLKKEIENISRLIIKKLKLKGLGLKAFLIQDRLELKLGYSHIIKILVPNGIKISILKNTITLAGTNLDALGNFAFKLKMLKRPNIYKGKGIWYRNESISLKPIKKS